MHILLIHQAFAAIDEPGGTRHFEMATYLAEKGHRVTIIASPVSYLTGKSAADSRSPSVSGPDDRIAVHRTYTYPALHRSFVHRVFSFLSFMVSSLITGLTIRDVDIVWGTSPPIFQGITSLVIARVKRTPFLFEVRDLWPAFAIDVGVLRNRFLISISEWLERFLYRHADRVIVNSPGFIDHVKKRGGRQVKVIPNGSDPEMFDPNDEGESFRVSHGLEDHFVVLYAGAHGMSNDLGVLLDAAGLLRDQSRIKIVFVGDGKEKLALVDQAGEMDLNNVIFLPPYPKTQMPEVLAGADSCVAILKPVPLYATVYPNKVFDYMAAGRPVILAIDGVIRKVVEEADAGIFVEPGNPELMAEEIKQLSVSYQRTQIMGKNGRSAVEEDFGRKKLTQEFAGIIEKMVDEQE